jgi:fido (protein-threonine AMPylation protein)
VVTLRAARHRETARRAGAVPRELGTDVWHWAGDARSTQWPPGEVSLSRTPSTALEARSSTSPQ